MKKEDLKVGMVIEHYELVDREVLYIGEGKYFYKNKYVEGSDYYTDISSWTPQKEIPEFFYVWRIKDGRRDSSWWYIPDSYVNESGERTDGSVIVSWGYHEKVKIKSFNPIDKDGNEYEWSEVE